MKSTFRTPVVATELRLPGQSERLVGADGSLNAGSKKELMQQVARLIELAGHQEVITETEANRRAEIAKLQGQMMMASFRDKEVHRELGEIMADDLYIASNRDGFARRFLVKQDLQQGQLPRVKMRMKNVTATIASGPSKIETQVTQDNQFWAPEFDLVARPFVTKREADQSVSDVVDEKFVEGLESLMVAEDRIWKGMADKTIGLDNPLTNVVGTLNPQAMMNVKNYVTSWNIPARYLLIANDIWNDIVADPSWMNAIDQVSKHEVLLTGQLGTVYGMDIISDAFRHPFHKVLNRGEFYVVGDAVNHGTMSDRGGVESTPTDISTERTPGRGWVLLETISMVIANSRSIAKGIR
jgi:hypothetical protein